MQPVTSPRRGLRLVIAAAAVVAMLGLVAVSVRSGFGHASTGPADRTYINYAFTLFLILLAALIPAAIYTLMIQVREQVGVKRSHPVIQFVRAVGTIALFVLLAYLLHDRLPSFGNHRHTPPKIKTPPSATDKLPSQLNPDRNAAPKFELTLLWVVLALLFVALAVAVVMQRRRHAAAELEAAPGMAEDVAATIDDAIDDLEREPDPRRAVIAAYARMESVLDRHGVVRRASDTPLEFMRRALVELGAGGSAVARLTGLFEEAKFSRHPIGIGMKRDAITSLLEIRAAIA